MLPRDDSCASVRDSTIARQIFVNLPLPSSHRDNNGRPKEKFVTNKVDTAKYTAITFLPKNISEQFRRIANCFFLLLAILQCFEEFKTIDPLVSALPLIIIVALTAIKDGVEDWKRHATDDTVNHRTTYTLGNWTNTNMAAQKSETSVQRLSRVASETFWGVLGYIWIFFSHFIATGNKGRTERPPLERTESNSSGIFPASPARANPGTPFSPTQPQPVTPPVLVDPNILSGPRSTTDPYWKETFWKDVCVGDMIFLRNNEFIPADIIILSTSEPDGLCYVQTKNLDGETNLKIRRGIAETADVRTAKDCSQLKLRVDSEPPTTNLFTYNGAVVLNGTDSNGASAKAPLNLNSMLLRGCILRNTEYVIGLVIFTGADTKLQLNSGETPSKRSAVEKKMNPQVLFNLLVMFVICIITAVGSKIWATKFREMEAPFVMLTNDFSSDPGYNAFLEFWGSLITFQNLVPISLILTVEIVKTVQSFFIYQDVELYHSETDTPCSPRSWTLSDDLGQIEYIFSDKTGTLTRNVMEFRKCSIGGKPYVGNVRSDLSVPEGIMKSAQNEPTNASSSSRPYASPDPSFQNAAMFAELESKSSQGETIRQFFTMLAVCHTVLARRPDPANNFKVEYKAQSPDEAALVQTAKDCGFTFLNRDANEIEVDIMGQKEGFTLLNVLEFNSTRKRMSIIVRAKDDTIVLMCKGADNVIFERLSTGQEDICKATGYQLESFADEGLRTLCIAQRVLPPELYDSWKTKYEDASTSLENREEKMDACAEEIEKELMLIGATAIEDRLQEGVPEAIATLSRAGIKIWVLTGDKLETAISIGFSCNLLTRDMDLIVIKGGTTIEPGAPHKQIQDALAKFWDPDGNPYTKQSFAMIIDGPSLKFALEEPCRARLLELACRCRAVICCRVSPLQKAKVVELVRFGKDVMTCAIGDGANDVSMIQAAHVGVGISGEEGLQAVMASDYAIAQFRFLCRLLLVHGRYSYLRTGHMILNFFYKNFIWTMVIFFYQFFCGYSNQLVFDFTMMLLYNIFFTCFPVITLGVFDRDIDAATLVNMPQLYLTGVRQSIYTTAQFATYILEGFYQAVICFFVPLGAYQYGAAANNGGRTSDLYEMGTCMAVCAIASANLFVGFNTHSWTWPHHISIWLSALSGYAYVIVYSVLSTTSPLFGFYHILYASLTFWLTSVICVVLAILPRYVLRYAIRTFSPSDTNIVEEIGKYSLARPLKRALTTSATTVPQEATTPARDVASGRKKSSSSYKIAPLPPSPDGPSSHLAPPSGITDMRTGSTSRHRGFSFSQEEGMRDVLTRCTDVRRRRTMQVKEASVTYDLPTRTRRKSLPTVHSSDSLCVVPESLDSEAPVGTPPSLRTGRSGERLAAITLPRLKKIPQGDVHLKQNEPSERVEKRKDLGN